jgi:hypothetical protein
MTRTINIALAVAAGIVCINAYTNTPVDFNNTLECANCVRSGNNFCLYLTTGGNQTVQYHDCSQDMTKTTGNITGPGGVPESYYCSSGMDQMNAIVGACRPWINQNTNDYCGPYLVDLTDSNNFTVGNVVQNLPTNASCTYRAISTCGYPEAHFRVHNASYRSDFDVAWATEDGMTPDEDL